MLCPQDPPPCVRTRACACACAGVHVWMCVLFTLSSLADWPAEPWSLSTPPWCQDHTHHFLAACSSTGVLGSVGFICISQCLALCPNLALNLIPSCQSCLTGTCCFPSIKYISELRKKNRTKQSSGFFFYFFNFYF